MCKRVSLLAGLVLACFMQAGLSAEEAFKPLFNGRDLSGWVNVNCAPDTWQLKDGIVFCTGVPTGALRTERQYENFILEAEWRHLKSGGNAGIFIWSSPITAPGVPFLRAIEVQVLDAGYGDTESHTTHGDVFPIHGSTMKPFGKSKGQRSFPSEKRSKPSPEWNHYRVECRDGVLRLHVNGKEVSGGEECNWRKGYLALESEGGQVEWRNLRIQELPPSGATPEQSAPEAEGHRSLYSGKDLSGWKVPADSGWKAADWKLVSKSDKTGEPIRTEQEFGDGEFVIDCRLAGNTNGEPAVLFGGSGTDAKRIPLNGLKPGKWSRFVITARGGEAKVTRDGEEVPLTSSATLPPGKRAIGLQSIPGEVEFAGLYVKER